MSEILFNKKKLNFNSKLTFVFRQNFFCFRLWLAFIVFFILKLQPCLDNIFFFFFYINFNFYNFREFYFF